MQRSPLVTNQTVSGTLLLLWAIALLVPGLNTIPPVDRDEPRFTEASRKIAEAQDWQDQVVPYYDGRPRLNKPPLIYWVQALFVQLLSTDHADGHGAEQPKQIESSSRLSVTTAPFLTGQVVNYRIPSVLCAVIATFVTWRLGRRMMAPSAALLGAMLLPASLVVMVDARLARVDELLLLWVVLTQTMLWNIWRAGRSRPADSDRTDSDQSGRARWLPAVGFWLFFGLGVMTKGPIVPAVTVSTAVAICLVTRRWHWLTRLKPFVGIGILALMVVPWMLAVAEVVGWDVLLDNIRREVLGRGTSSMEGHGGLPGYYLLLLLVTFWPGNLALVPAAWHAWRRGLVFPQTGARLPRAGRAAELFCICWIVPSWLLFELAATKLPHYTLPTYPALALLCGRAILAGQNKWNAVLRWIPVRLAFYAWYFLAELLCVGLPVAMAVIVDVEAAAFLRSLLVLIAAIDQLLLVISIRRYRRSGIRSAFAWAMAAVPLMSVAVFGLGMPNTSILWLPSRVVSILRDWDPEKSREWVASGYAEDSLVFLTEEHIRRAPERMLVHLLERSPGAIFVTRRSLIPDGTRFARSVELSGFNYSRGRWVEVVVFELAVEP